MRRAAVCFNVLGMTIAPAAAQPAEWTGARSNLWHVAENWSPNAVPGSGNDVVIRPGYFLVVAQSAIGNVGSVSAESPLAIGHGVSSFARQSTFADLTVVNNVLTAGGPVTINGNSSMGGVTFAGAVQWKSLGTMEVNPGLVIQSGTTFINQGTVNVQGSLTLSGVGSLMDNRGTLVLVDAPVLSNGLLINSGTLRKTGAGTSAIGCRTQGSGPIDVRGGTLRLEGSSALGPFPCTVAADSGVLLGVPAGPPLFHSLSGTVFSGAGSVEVNAGGTLQSQTMRVVDDTSFNLRGSTAALRLRAGMLYVGSGGIVRNSGKALWESLRLHGPGELVNDAGGDLTFVASFSPVIGPDATVINRASARVATNISIDAATLLNEGQGLLELGPVQINSPAPAQATLVNNSALIFPPDDAPGTQLAATVRCRFEQSGGGFTWARPGKTTSTELSFLGGGEFGAGGSEVQIGRPGGGSPQESVTVRLGGGTFRVTGSGHVVRGANPTARFFIEGAGTIVEIAGGAELELRVGRPSAGTFEAANLQGLAQLGGPGTCRNTGRFLWQGQIGVGGMADFRNEPGGEIDTHNGAPILRGTLTNADGATVTQTASLDMAGGNVQNHGVWRFRPSNAAAISGASATFKNHKRFEADGAAGTISVTLDNPGHVVAQGGTLSISGPVTQIVGDALVGGTWEAAGRGKLLFTQTFLRRFDGAKVIGGTEGIPAAEGVREVTRGGEVQANDAFLTDGPLTVKENGKVAIDPGGSVNVPGGVTNGAETGPPDPSRIEQRSQGEGPGPVLVTPQLVNHASLYPGGESAAGPFNLVGNLDQRGRGVVHVDLGGLVAVEEFDQVLVDGDATLDGTLRVRLLGAFLPEVGQVFDILSVTGTIGGSFATHDLQRLPGGAKLSVVSGPRSVSLRVESACYPDCDPGTGTGVLDIFDFLCFQNAFAAADPYACDCDLTGGPRVCDIFDFLCFQNAFAAGCP